MKIGFPNPNGWIGYHVDSTLFVKKAEHRRHTAYFDRGSSSECYCNPQFLELETLGPRTTLNPGESVTHREVWELHGGISFTPTEEAALALAKSLGLAANGR